MLLWHRKNIAILLIALIIIIIDEPIGRLEMIKDNGKLV